MIIVDGRIDREKLFELLETSTECDELDLKETLDFSKKLPVGALLEIVGPQALPVGCREVQVGQGVLFAKDSTACVCGFDLSR